MLHFRGKTLYGGRTAASATPSAPRISPSAFGERVRQLRIARGLTQTELGLGRFTKEYISQIERGRARPRPETVAWLATRLGVTRGFLETGVPESERARVAGAVAQAEAAVAARRHEEALACLAQVGAPDEDWDAELRLRALVAAATAHSELGRVGEAIELLVQAREIAEDETCSDLDRATVLFHLGRCRYLRSSIRTATALFTEALELMRRGDVVDDRLRSRILRWRSRCYRRERDWEGAREDVEAALELAERLGDREALAHAYFQASIIAERQGQWVLARRHAERAKELYEEQEDQLAVGRLLNNLGGLTFLLGDADEAVGLLKRAFATAVEVASPPDAAQAVSSLAQIDLRLGRLEDAERQARHALELLGDRVDFLDERGNALLVLGRALLGRDRLDEAEAAFAAAEAAFDALGSASHRAAAWTAQAELSVRRGDDAAALRLYRRATEALQDFRF